MESVIPHVTKLQNGTEVVPLQFLILVKGFAIAGLNPGRKLTVDLSKVLRICRHLESASWTIEILINQGSSGLKLTAQHLLDYVVIVFELRRLENGKYILAAKGVRERKIDKILRMGRGIGTILGRDRVWKRRKFELIAEAPPIYARRIPQLSGCRQSTFNNNSSSNTEENKRVPNICSTVEPVVPEVELKSEKMSASPPRKKENPQAGIKTKDSVKQNNEVDPLERVTGDARQPELSSKREGRDSFFVETHVVQNIEHEDHANATHSSDSVDFVFLFLFALLVTIIFRML